ncbi:DNA-binding LacI/PurR family transcriptional regulator [Peribacillus deserti]|uniref:DNA-binding LacI/PurR family transcriptional regulator n=1 Tax=Peribacillus deserti TaxID=673318 RepID=A0ABS2QI24_9BACI|nr:substrate-binding domain-containing protein [Peribacillus deserti]MBM7692742.1 DNA-binding LacI/PurR family transcriptional regulator [Peribacillus deserti]
MDNRVGKKILAKNRPTAVFATDDLKVMSIYKMAGQCGISIPEDLSVIGYSNSNIYPFLSPSLTCKEIPVKKLGEIATQVLFSKIKENKGPKPHTIIETDSIIQESVACI